MNERISLLIDHELTESERQVILGQIMSDDEAIRCWKHYHLIGSVMRNEITSTGVDLTDHIGSQLEQEPTVVSSRAGTRHRIHPTAKTWKISGLFALAASIVLLAVIVLSPIQEESGQSASLVGERVAPRTMAQQQFANDFGVMLAKHGEFSSSTGLNGLVVYSKLVTNQPMHQ